MTALTHHITSRTVVATAFLAAALAALIVALAFGISAASAHSPGGQGSPSTSGSHPAHVAQYGLPGCLVCYR
jgi:hypothetical protein